MQEDFELYKGVDVLEVKTVVEKTEAQTTEDLENVLITFWESAAISHRAGSNIH